MDTAYIQSAERHLIAIILEEIEANGSYKKHTDFAKAAFGDEVANYNNKWLRLRTCQNNITFSDIVRIGIVLQIEPSLLIAQAYNNLRKGKSVSI